jgi:DNA-binding NarL/FixJ family response regulator
MNKADKIKVAITDDHPMIITGLQNMFAVHPHIVLTGVYTNGKELLDGLRNIHLPDKTGDKLASMILKKYPGLRIIALTNLDSSFYIYNMVKDGVLGYLLKNADGNSIISAVEAVYKGEKYMARELKAKMEAFAQKMKSRETLRPTLTQKEKEVLQLTVQGYTLQKIAEKLFLGQRTVEYYRSNLFLKLEVSNLAELIRKALESGMMDEPLDK